ncbi:hypothetical protein [Deminuibacter soli]|uniref:Nucleotidyltransferase domain-containing protein n=1 Tax=Deminuibacter soli TaxID=2291815 RepID=A0A3E1NK71_9BACT|nr:hypothetical protein [Deminuibacter soli]RFM28271.1 hypothetical protein DXN05_12220 [Deminuibacter soli]
MTNSYTESVLKVLAYFDIFNYPVKLDEIRYFLDQPVTEKKLTFALQQLQDQQLLWHMGEFYCLRNDITLVERRLHCNAMAVKQLKRAMLFAKLIRCFPYVKGVAVSGSLSKNVAYEGSDLDFFLVMQKDRLWIGRTLLHIPVKIAALLGLPHYACLNYYIDESALEIPEQNMFTAMEVATMLPVQNSQRVFQRFYHANQWAYHFLPGHKPRIDESREFAPGYLRRFMEWIFDGAWGSRLDDRIMGKCRKRWELLSQSPKRNPKGFPFGAIAEKHYCKPYPYFFQKKVLSQLDEKMYLLSAKRKQALDN